VIVVNLGGRGKTIRLLLLLSLSTLICACSNAPRVAGNPPDFSGDGPHPVYITHHGWHTGVVVPAPPMQERLPGLEERFPAARYLEFGWGDKNYYQAEDASARLAIQAALWPTDTVMRVIAVSGQVENRARASGLVGLCVDRESLDALLDFLEQSFSKNRGGELQASQTRSEINSQFFEGSGQYHLFNTCNTWIARALRTMGMDISPTLKLTAGSVVDYLEQHPKALVIRSIEEGFSADQPTLSCGE
jgi:uncharacterized protein (TIGR02117 family)